MSDEERAWQLIGGEISRIGNRLAVVSLLIAGVIFLDAVATDLAKKVAESGTPVTAVIGVKDFHYLTYTVTEEWAKLVIALLWGSLGVLLVSILLFWVALTKLRNASTLVRQTMGYNLDLGQGLINSYRATLLWAVFGDMVAAVGYALLLGATALLALVRFAPGLI